ncbi:MAG: hypothetical protein A2X85_16770 [Geobacteraceae bacterium GWF2_54_21]|nr:MAG: hypothetical protein A2X85_16770 [Geobacteraceae bacterium GWF2_54_21]HBA72754.1 hypothetical protein [Geobacter sp.]
MVIRKPDGDRVACQSSWETSVESFNTIDKNARQARITLPLKEALVMKQPSPPRSGKRLIFREWRTINGKPVHASEYGLKAWPLWV